MMLDRYTPSELPNGSGYNAGLKTDESTYRRIHDAAKRIETHCALTHHPGWARIGE